MAERKVFPHPPVTEALIEFQVPPKPIDTLPDLIRFHEAVIEHYPHRQERMTFSAGIHIKAGGTPEVVTPFAGPGGYLLSSEDKKQVVQARLDGFALSILKYSEWEDFRSLFQELWIKYVDIVRPSVVTRIGLRYINRIDLPLPVDKISDYILTYPELAEGIPNGLEELFMRLVIPDSDTGSKATVIETFGSPTPDGKLPFIMDVDAFKQTIAIEPSESQIWTTLDALHDLESRVFFNSITQKAEELFK